MKFRSLILVIVFVFVTSTPCYSKGMRIDPRVIVMGKMAIFGTAGGALLGLASLAFEDSDKSAVRSIAVGASLGLYAGLLFGSYVAISHAVKNYQAANPRSQTDYYPDDSASPYGEEEYDSPYEDEGYQEDMEAEEPQKWNPYHELKDLSVNESRLKSNRFLKTKDDRPVFYLNLFNYQF